MKLEKLSNTINFNYYAGMVVVVINVLSYSIGNHYVGFTSLALFSVMLVYLDHKHQSINAKVLEDYGEVIHHHEILVHEYSKLSIEYEALKRKSNELQG